MDRTAGTVLIVLGIAAVIVGVLVSVGAFSWFGRLPGDVRFSSGRTRVFVPFTSMLLVSVVASVLLNLLLRR